MQYRYGEIGERIRLIFGYCEIYEFRFLYLCQLRTHDFDTMGIKICVFYFAQNKDIQQSDIVNDAGDGDYYGNKRKKQIPAGICYNRRRLYS